MPKKPKVNKAPPQAHAPTVASFVSRGTSSAARPLPRQTPSQLNPAIGASRSSVGRTSLLGRTNA